MWNGWGEVEAKYQGAKEERGALKVKRMAYLLNWSRVVSMCCGLEWAWQVGDVDTANAGEKSWRRVRWLR